MRSVRSEIADAEDRLTRVQGRLQRAVEVLNKMEMDDEMLALAKQCLHFFDPLRQLLITFVYYLSKQRSEIDFVGKPGEVEHYSVARGGAWYQNGDNGNFF